MTNLSSYIKVQIKSLSRSVEEMSTVVEFGMAIATYNQRENKLIISLLRAIRV